MAKFNVNLPDGIIKDFTKINDNADKIFGEMTKAGAEVAASNMRASAPDTIKSYVRVSKTYKTPSDGGINTKAYISGYIPFSDANRKYFSRRGRAGGAVYSTSKGVPAEFIAILYEYGRSTAPFPKRPFLRRSFGTTSKIKAAMLEAQKKASGGLLDE